MTCCVFECCCREEWLSDGDEFGGSPFKLAGVLDTNPVEDGQESHLVRWHFPFNHICDHARRASRILALQNGTWSSSNDTRVILVYRQREIRHAQRRCH